MINIPNLTQNYNLSKPLGSERVDVNVLNKNSDILDTTLKSISIKSEAAYNHSNSAHARTDATKTEKSNINGNILINGVETEVYRHPLGRNPHGLIKSDIGLGNVDNTSDINKPVSIAQQEAINNAVKNKVDKVNGKGLSTNDYTTEEKNKLASINVSAEENQNAFSKVKVGNKTISSNEKMGTFELVAGNNVGLSVDSNTNKITISSTGGSGSSNASDISYDNTTSGLSSTEVQSAIDELHSRLSNPNLLDNPWFTVNQRGKTGYTEEGYAVDRWCLQNVSGSGSLNIDENKNIAITTKNNDGIKQVLRTKLEIGKTYTISFNDKNTIHSKSFVWGGEGIVHPYGNETVVYFAIILNNNFTWVYPYVQYTNEIKTDLIMAVKLELGDISTLANDTAPDYAMELMKCSMSTADPSDMYTNKIITLAYSPDEPSSNLMNGLIWIG